METAFTFDNAQLIPIYIGPWTEEDYLALPEMEGRRVELIDGDLIVSPLADSRHQRFVGRLWDQFERLLPDEIVAVPPICVQLRTDRILIPDVVVTSDLSDQVFFEARDVVLVAEVTTESSRARDRLFKPFLYAEAGIPWYLLVEQEPTLELILHRREQASYVEHARAGEGETLEIPDLCAIEVDALLRRR
jgi:Uma2 family endonuclease